MSEEFSLEKVRAMAQKKGLPKEELERFHAGHEDERMISTRYGETRVLFYAPASEGKYTLVINLHGGGFVQGHRDEDVVFCRNMVENAGVAVVSIDYHTAPEKKYPYALYECYDVVKYVFENIGSFLGDPEKVVLMGHSAGGNLVCGIQFLAQAQNAFQPALLAIEYPPMDFTVDPGDARYAYAPFIRIPVEKARNYDSWYIDREHIREITASPVYAIREELENFPPTVMVFAEFDTLREPAQKFAYKLIDAGVSVTAKMVKGAGHSFTVKRGPGFEVAETFFFEALEKVKNGTIH